MSRLISFCTARYYIMLERAKLALLRKILRSEINSGHIVQCYGSCEALLDDLCDSNYQDEIMDFAIGSTTGHMRHRTPHHAN